MECEVSETENTDSPVGDIALETNDKVSDKIDVPVTSEPVLESKPVASEMFKKPLILIGPKRTLKPKLSLNKHLEPNKGSEVIKADDRLIEESKEKQTEEQETKVESKPINVEKVIPLPYTTPSWAGIPKMKYYLEVCTSYSYSFY